MPTKIAEKVLSWASILDEKALRQAELTATLPFVAPHLALMPDAHLGRGATVGSVIPTDGAIIPAAVGVDIGCGMDAVRTQFTASDLADPVLRRVIRQQIERTVPLSAGRHNTVITETSAARIEALETLAANRNVDVESYSGRWRAQLGSLGSGNHFIEVSLDEADRVWLFLHSGSRGVGNLIAQRHIKVARELMERYFIELPDLDLAYLVQGTDEFNAYVNALVWAQAFARENRAEMMDRVAMAVGENLGAAVERIETISCHHNYTTRENHFGRNMWVSRKGAIDAHEGVLGLIPGSMGTRSYVVEGRGNPASMCSAPHGAGRAFSRSSARKRFTYEQLATAMDGIEWSGSGEFIDEIPGAYKDIDQVMADAADLVTIRHELRQIINVKGD